MLISPFLPDFPVALKDYSEECAREHMHAQLEDMMRDADDDKTREAIRRCMEQIERA